MVGIRFTCTILFFFSCAGAQALSCAPPQFDTDAIESLGIIFEGVVEEEKGPTLWKRFKINFKIDDDDPKTTYTFKITRLWKGTPEENERVKIIASPGWEQQSAYQVGNTYMVFGESPEKSGDKPGVYTARPGWCGFDLLPKEQVIKVLELYSSEKNQTTDNEYDSVNE